VLLTDLEENTTQEFASMTALGTFLNVSKQTISKYVQTGKAFRGRYLILRGP